MEEQQSLFLDNIGRTILGTISSETTDELLIKNPVIVHISPNEGRMAVQLIPILFREFLADKQEDVVFAYKKANITTTNVTTIDVRLKAQYTQLFSPTSSFMPPTSPVSTPAENGNKEEPKVISLFD